MEHLRLQLLEASEQRQLKRERFVAGYLVQCSSVMHEIVELLSLDSTWGNADQRARRTTKLSVTNDLATQSSTVFTVRLLPS